MYSPSNHFADSTKRFLNRYLPFYRFDAKPNQNLIAIRREPLVQLNKDSRNVAVPASTYGENGMIENVPKKLTNGVIASENEVIRFNF